MSSVHARWPAWVSGEGPDADVVITTRARLARSVQACPFPSRASREDLSMVAREVRRACAGLADRFPKLKAVRMERLGTEQKSYLLDSHVASAEHVKGGPGRIVITEPTGTLSVMVNEEDHVRLQCLKSGLAPEEAWELVDWADDVLSAELDFGFSNELGYLTASVSNVGTGLRVSVLMHLGGLSMTGSVGRVMRAAWDLGVSVRGLYGEGSDATGDLFQVSNEVTLGVSERELVQKVRSVAQYLLDAERSARKEVIDKQRNRVMDEARKALRVLQGAMSLRSEEAIGLLSPLRVAAGLGVVHDCPIRLLNEMLISVQAGAGDDLTARMSRAALSKRKLADVLLQPD